MIGSQYKDKADNSKLNMILSELNNTAGEYPRNYNIYELIDEQVKRVPLKDAVIFKNKKISYASLNDKVNQVANMLLDSGVKKGDIVVLMANRSIEMVQGILGILKSGAVCLPLDIKYPQDRIAFILQDCGARYILKQGEVVILPAFDGKIIDIDICEESSSQPIKNSETISPENVAFVIYTSGSSGRPKGVLLRHSGIINHSYTKISVLKLNEEDYICHNFSISFVPSIWLILTTLIIGAKLYICDEEMMIDPYKLFSNVYENHITIMEVTPSHLNTYLNILNEGKEKIDFGCLKVLVLTGEKILPSIVNKFYRVYDTRLVNAYGQSECSDDTLHFEIPKNSNTQAVPIGKPSMNTRIYILDSKYRLQPEGVTGELYISGDGLAEGYLNRDDLTKLKFVPNPYEKGNLMYATGDLVRILPDLNLEYIGRTDRQIKARSFTIELDEIEKVLSEHKDIKEAVIVDRDDEKGNKYICAYYVPNKKLSGMQLRDYLSKKLPDYMIPSFFINLDRLPKNPNGKLERLLLPEPKDLFIKNDKKMASKNGIEEKVIDTWRKNLSVGSIGIDDNFFIIGGDSIKAIQICACLNKYGIKVDIRDIYMHPTVRELCTFIESNGDLHLIKNKDTNDTSACCAMPEVAKIDCDTYFKSKTYVGNIFGLNAEVQSVYPVSPSQEMLLFYALHNKNSKLYYEQLSFSIHKKIDFELLGKSFNLLIKRHDILRTIFTYKALGKPMQIVLAERKTKIYCEDISNKSISERHIVIDEFTNKDKEKGFDVLKDVLIRLAVFKISTDEYKIVLSYHHIILDGWSTGLIINELNSIYEQIENNSNPYLECTYQYYNYIDWLNAQNKQEAFLYWDSYLKGYKQEKNSFDKFKKKSEANITGHEQINEYTFKLSQKQTYGIIKVAKSNKVTVSALMFSVWGTFLNLLNQSNDTVFGIIASGRPSTIEDVDKMLGLFVNVVPLRVNNQVNVIFKDLVKDVHKALIYGDSYSYFPLIELQKKLGLKTIDHVIGFQNYPEFEKIEDKSIVRFIEQSNYNLKISIIPQKQFSISFTYNTAVYNNKAFPKIKKCILNILGAILENPEIEFERLKNMMEADIT